MVGTVIVPLDGSEAAEQALPFARLLAQRHGARLLLMTVLEVSSEFDAWVDTAPFSLEQEIDNWLAERRQYLQDRAEKIGEGTETVVRVGRPADEIGAVVEESDDALLVMASHGRGGIQQFVLGSVALKVVHDVHSPVVVVHIQDDVEPPATLDSVLLPLDGSEFSAQIVERALDIAGEPRPSLQLVQVLETPPWAGYPLDAGLVGQYIEAGRELAEEDLKAMAARLIDAGYTVNWAIRDGNAGDQIIAAAQESGTSLIAMATHGRGGLGRLLLGSVAQRVLNRATVPLLLIHPETT